MISSVFGVVRTRDIKDMIGYDGHHRRVDAATWNVSDDVSTTDFGPLQMLAHEIAGTPYGPKSVVGLYKKSETRFGIA